MPRHGSIAVAGVGWASLVSFAATPLGVLTAHGATAACGLPPSWIVAGCTLHWTAMCLAMLPVAEPLRFTRAARRIAGWSILGVILLVCDAFVPVVGRVLQAFSVVSVAASVVIGAFVAASMGRVTGRALSLVCCGCSMAWCFYRASLSDMVFLTLVTVASNWLARPTRHVKALVRIG